ncbi:uncharacterized protein GGS22DRAFT_197704 [Annulohypoxylon maeteangense]|uniref:uncharacterized protein n=1 Tax=Annulohypoxylon maeteangense TaxID=1927788 RepID=UPI0020089B1F|nr:uncharacterized protein GGS22DRAFT_197704 [Annulohypoxylon maeteangense]KAI0887729.1 hypothetical protein GGS22DRAFT_197704 [Annulohypoxylon maeteangense]
MPRTLLLCFLHGFKGDDDTFRTFPSDLQQRVATKLPDHNVESIVYPKYETRGELAPCCSSFLSWLKEKVMNIRKAQSETPWPPHDRDVGVILVAHSMGGFVASDTLFLVLNERIAHGQEGSPIFPLIQGILTFDTPFNGLARSMFVYGAFSNYQKVSTVFNVMTALSAAPSALGKSAFKKTATRVSSTKPSNPAWKGWQLIAVRTGTVGAIAAGGVAAYVHRQKIMDGMRSMRNLNKDSVKEGYQQSMDTLSQGLAYINRGNVGKSFEYLSDHFTFVGTLMKQQELARRLERIAALQGIGIHDFFTSLGENGMWSGGYFVPERTFCAIPVKDHQAHHIFSRQVIKKTEDEVQAHMSMFIRDKNQQYDQMTEEASNLVIRWFNDDSDIVDDPKFAMPTPPETIEQPVATMEDGQEVPKIDGIAEDTESTLNEIEEQDGSDFPDASPLDITAAASAIPLPDSDEEAPQDNEAKQARKGTYMRYLMQVAQQAGTGVKSYVPTRMPEMPQIPSGSSLKSYLPTQMPQIPSIPNPSVSVFSKRKEPAASEKDNMMGVSEPEVTIESTSERKRADSGVHLTSEPTGSTELRRDPTTMDQSTISTAK